MGGINTPVGALGTEGAHWCACERAGRNGANESSAVNPVQASKVQLWMPTPPEREEGCHAVGKNRYMHLRRSTGVVGMARTEGLLMQRGRTDRVRGCARNVTFGLRHDRESERFVVPGKPGNSGGGKGPHFWVLLKEKRTRGLA